MKCPTHLFEQVPDSHGTADDETHQVFGVKLIIEQLCRHRRRKSVKRSKCTIGVTGPSPSAVPG